MTEEELKAKVKDLRRLLFADEYDEAGESIALSLALLMAEEVFDSYFEVQRPYKVRENGEVKKRIHHVTISEQLEEIIEVLWKIYNAM